MTFYSIRTNAKSNNAITFKLKDVAGVQIVPANSVADSRETYIRIGLSDTRRGCLIVHAESDEVACEEYEKLFTALKEFAVLELANARSSLFEIEKADGTLVAVDAKIISQMTYYVPTGDHRCFFKIHTYGGPEHGVAHHVASMEKAKSYYDLLMSARNDQSPQVDI